MAAERRLDDIFSHIDAQREGFAARLIDYVRHPSISAHNIGITEVADLLLGMLTGLGLDAQLVATAGHPMVVARWLKQHGAPTVLLYGHYDVQPPDPLELWISRHSSRRSATAEFSPAASPTTKASTSPRSWRSSRT
jgi:acetylornithine deacetylase/succinyl-diaminopimelate desuccinylase-like protein